MHAGGDALGLQVYTLHIRTKSNFNEINEKRALLVE